MSTVSSTHITHYREEGYCLIPNLIPQPLIEAARLRALEIGQQLAPWPSSHFQVLNPERYRSKYDTLLPAGIQRPASQEAVFADVADHANLAEAMAALLSGPVERFTDQIGIKHGTLNEAQGGCSYFTTGRSRQNWAATVGYLSPLWAPMPMRWPSCRKRIRAGS